MAGPLSNLRERLGAMRVELRPVDVVLVAFCAPVAAFLLGPAAWAPGARASGLVFGLFALGPLVLRLWEAGAPASAVRRFAGDFWLLPVASFGHAQLNPLVDALQPVLQDAALAAADLRLFGVHPALWLGPLVPGWLVDVLLVCYYGHFLWPLVAGLVIFSRCTRAAFDEYLFGLGLLFCANYGFYALVPAVGPRFFLFEELAQPLQGWLLTPLLESLMRMPYFLRDCFPSGHTGITLLVLLYAWRFVRGFFWVMLLPALGLIAATLVGRFHYGIDLVAALPMVLVVTALARVVARVRSGAPLTAAQALPPDALVRTWVRRYWPSG